MAGPQQNLGARTALVLFGSETGNSQDVAKEIGHLCERLRFAAHVCELNSIDIVSLNIRQSTSLLIRPGRGNCSITLLLSSPFPPLARGNYLPILSRSGDR